MSRHSALKRLIGTAVLCAFSILLVRAGARRSDGPVALLNSDYTGKVYHRQKADYPLLFSMWHEAVRRQGFDVQVITDADLEHGDLQRYSALVLPGSVALSDAEWQAVRRFVQSGGGLLLGGAAGTLTAEGGWRGWEAVQDLAGLHEVRALRKKNFQSLYITLMGGSPVTLNLPAGLRIENTFYNENYAGLSPRQDAYWSDFNKPLYVSDPNTYYTAITTAHYGPGRVAWFGFNLESMSDQPDNQRILLTLFGNTLRWLKQEPIAQVSQWPQGKRTAVSLTFDCENDFGNLANLLNRRDVSAFHFTFFMLSSMAEQFPELVRQSTALGEVAIHGDDHSIFKAQSYETQEQRLERAQRKLQALSGTPVVSFRPPLQRFDGNTLIAMKKAGVKNFFSDYTLSSTPYFQTVGRPGSGASAPDEPAANTLVTFPRPNYDDYDLFVRYRLSNDQAIEYLTEDFNRVDKERGLYILNMHTTSPWGGLTRHKIRVLSTLIHALEARDDLWLPTIGEVGAWMQMRRGVALSLTRDWDESWQLEVANRNDQRLRDVVVEIYLPNALSNLRIDTAGPSAQPTWRLEQSPAKLLVTIPQLQPREVKHYRLASGPPEQLTRYPGRSR